MRHYMLAFDKIKQHSVKKEIHIMADGKTVRPNYENTILFLLYHPDPNIMAMFKSSTRKQELAWDFTTQSAGTDETAGFRYPALRIGK